jgi:hypothetical protein
VFGAGAAYAHVAGFITATSRLMLFREIIAVYCENRTKHTNTPCGQNIKSRDTYGYCCASGSSFSVGHFMMPSVTRPYSIEWQDD